MFRVSISFPGKIVAIDRRRMRDVAETVLRGEGVQNAVVNLAFVDNPTMHELNKRYLDHDEPTDVLSFPLAGDKDHVLEGQLVIGVEVARAEARLRGHAVAAELSLYIIHGLLHLCGYDDRDAASARQMRARERMYLARLRLPDIAPKRS